MSKLIRGALLAVALSQFTSARAQSLWTGAVDFDWNASGNWLNDGVDFFGGPPTHDGTADVLFSTPAVALPDTNYVDNNHLTDPWHVRSITFDDQADGNYAFRGNPLTIGEPAGVGTLTQTFLNPLASFDYPYVAFENNVTLAAPTTINNGGWGFEGQLDIASHALTIDGAEVAFVGPVANWGTVTLMNGGVMDFRDNAGANASTPIDPLPSGTSIVLGAGGGTMLFPEADFGTDDYTINYSPNLNNITGAGTLTLGGTFNSDTFLPSHTGGTILGNSGCGCGGTFDGIWRVGSNGLLPPGPVTVNFGSFIELDGHNFVFDTSSTPGVNAGPLTGHGAIYLDRYKYDDTRNGGLLVFITADSADTLHLGPDVYDSGIERGSVPGAEPGAIYKEGAGTLEINSASVYADVIVHGGTVKLTNYDPIAPGVPGSHGFFRGFQLDAGTTLEIGDQITGLKSLSGSGEVVIGEQASFFGHDIPNLSITGESTFDGVIRDESVLPAQPGSVFIGNGTNTSVTLTGTSTYHGDTLVDDGRLNVTGALVNSRVVLKPEVPIAVDPDFGTQAILTGNGTIGGLLVSQSGIIEPANPNYAGASHPVPATLTVTGNAVFEGGGIYAWKISNATGAKGANPGWSHLAIGGTLEIYATATDKFQIQLNSMDECGCVGPLQGGFDSSLSYAWTIASAAGGIIMKDGSTTVPFDPAAFDINTDGFAHPLDGGSFSVSLGNSGHDLNVNFSPVPEPRDFVLVFGVGLVGFAAWRRARRRVA